jgi:hypothetical protein
VLSFFDSEWDTLVTHPFEDALRLRFRIAWGIGF